MSGPETGTILPLEPPPGSPVFAEPWQAEVLAVAFALTRSRLFSATDWAAMLGAEIRWAEDGSRPDAGTAYYAAALAALERLVADRAPALAASLPERIEAWRRAYLNTPHGHPVTLAAADEPVDHHHHDRDP